jgi:hypothetical protein
MAAGSSEKEPLLEEENRRLKERLALLERQSGSSGTAPYQSGTPGTLFPSAPAAPRVSTLVMMSVSSEGEDAEIAQRFEQLQKAAGENSQEAIVMLALAFSCGFYGAAVNKDEAVKLMQLAAKQSTETPAGMLAQAYCLLSEVGGYEENMGEALRLYRLAAEKNYAPAQKKLGDWYWSGYGGLSKDYKEALRLYQLAAAQGYVPAQFDAGYMFEKGEGAQQSHETAFKWYQQAAKLGHADALAYMGVYCYNGWVVPQDRELGVKYFRQSALLGSSTGQYQLGWCYEIGRGGLGQSQELAREWYSKAAAQGNEAAKAKLHSSCCCVLQ